jgi:hypothetical protein
MCGRFDNLIARDAYRGLFKANRLPKWNFPLRYNVAPTAAHADAGTIWLEELKGAIFPHDHYAF